MDKRTLKNITMDECKNQESQLDSLWEIYGDRNVFDNPTDAKGTDILSKDGMMILMSAICGDTIVDLKKVEDESKKKYNIVAVSKNEEERIVFSFMKEDFLKKVIVRKSTQIDVESGIISEPNIVCMEFIMNSGNNKLVEMSEFKYEGTRTSSIETYINKNNGIEAVLLLAQNSDPTLKVEITRNGLMISSLISENQNQAKLVKKPDGFGIENLWEDGFPIEFASMSYSEYKNLESSDASDLNGDESNIKNPSMNIKTGCIYFINDKGFMILNGVRYGFNSIDSNSISVSKDENGNYLFNVKISGDANNLLSIKNDGIYAGLNWSGSKQNEQFGIQYDLEDVYKALPQSEQSRILFICSDTKRVYANGIDISYVDKIGNKNDEDNSTVYGYINSKFLELKGIVDNIGVCQLGDLPSFNNLESELSKKEICLKQSNVIIPFTVTSSEGEENGFVVNIITTQGINQALYWKNADRPSLKRTLTVDESGNVQSVAFYPIDNNPYVTIGTVSLYTLKGLGTETESDIVKKAFEDFFTKKQITSQDLDKCFKYGYVLQDALFRDVVLVAWNGSSYDFMIIGRNKPKGEAIIKTITISISEDEIYSIISPYSEQKIITNANISNDEYIKNIITELSKTPKFEDFEYEVEGEKKKRKAIILDNYDVLFGRMLNGDPVTLAMVSMWDKADYGSSKLPINFNGSLERPTYNDDEEIALMKDIEEIKLPIEFSFPLRTLQDKVYTQEEILAWFGVTDAAELKTLIVREGQFYLKYGIQFSGNPYYYRMPIQYIAFESANQIKMVVIGLDTTNDMPTKYEIILNLDGAIAKGNSNIKVTSNDLAFANNETIDALTAQINELKELISSITSRVDALEKA